MRACCIKAAKDEAAISSSLLDVANAIALPYRVPSDLANTVAEPTPSLAGWTAAPY